MPSPARPDTATSSGQDRYGGQLRPADQAKCGGQLWPGRPRGETRRELLKGRSGQFGACSGAAPAGSGRARGRRRRARGGAGELRQIGRHRGGRSGGCLGEQSQELQARAAAGVTRSGEARTGGGRSRRHRRRQERPERVVWPWSRLG
jgi:hypothetical protein